MKNQTYYDAKNAKVSSGGIWYPSSFSPVGRESYERQYLKLFPDAHIDEKHLRVALEEVWITCGENPGCYDIEERGTPCGTKKIFLSAWDFLWSLDEEWTDSEAVYWS